MKKPLTDAEGEVRELGAEDIAAMRPAAEVLPPELVGVLPKRRPGERGKGRKPAKVSVTLRLSPDVLEYFRSRGAGWQTRIEETLKAAIQKS